MTTCILCLALTIIIAYLHIHTGTLHILLNSKNLTRNTDVRNERHCYKHISYVQFYTCTIMCMRISTFYSSSLSSSHDPLCIYVIYKVLVCEYVPKHNIFYQVKYLSQVYYSILKCSVYQL